jgi:pSer/pThr/pTyr-binding forkhead associated (FHA) protein
MTGKQEQLVTCPSCGQMPAQGEDCCDFERSKRQEKIPVIAAVFTASGEQVPIETRWMRMGRDADNDIVLLNDGYVSRFHAWVTFEQERFWVEDLGSTNGTLLNGEPLRRRELLASGDKIKIGESEMTFTLLEKTGSTA